MCEEWNVFYRVRWFKRRKHTPLGKFTLRIQKEKKYQKIMDSNMDNQRNVSGNPRQLST